MVWMFGPKPSNLVSKQISKPPLLLLERMYKVLQVGTGSDCMCCAVLCCVVLCCSLLTNMRFSEDAELQAAGEAGGGGDSEAQVWVSGLRL